MIQVMGSTKTATITRFHVHTRDKDNMAATDRESIIRIIGALAEIMPTDDISILMETTEGTKVTATTLVTAETMDPLDIKDTTGTTKENVVVMSTRIIEEEIGGRVMMMTITGERIGGRATMITIGTPITGITDQTGMTGTTGMTTGTRKGAQIDTVTGVQVTDPERALGRGLIATLVTMIIDLCIAEENTQSPANDTIIDLGAHHIIVIGISNRSKPTAS